MLEIRPELSEDYKSVFEVNRLAFETDAEARLVDALRPVMNPLISFVAVYQNRIAGHILFTRVTVEGNDTVINAMGLGPVAVLPELQNRGIGSKLIITGLETCRKIGEAAVFVVGHPKFYQRFGFQLAQPYDLHYKEPEYDPYFFVLELIPGTLQNISGVIKYHHLFDEV